MRLIELPDNGCSLEFSPDETASVMSTLRAIGDIEVTHEATYDILHVGRIRLVYMDEWDEPCLIANTTEGRGLLAVVAQPAEAELGEPPAESEDADLAFGEESPRRGWWQRTFGD